MHLKKIIKTLSASFVLALAATPVMAQDLLARQAPVDRKMKAVDTVALRILDFREVQTPVAQLYTEWNNKYAHRASQLPDTFEIDLRNFCMPIPSRIVTSKFGPRWNKQHKGLDIKGYVGDTIRTAFSGKVRMVANEPKGYGKYVVVRHPNGLETIYAHMSKHLVKEDQEIKAGTPVGLIGLTGRTTGAHLHFETRLCGVALNPALLFDFANQDVTGDTYVFRSRNLNRANSLANNNLQMNGEVQTAEGTSNNQTSGNTRTTTRKSANYHKVAKGETLYSIAKRRGVSVDQLRRINRLGKNAKIRPGQILRYS